MQVVNLHTFAFGGGQRCGLVLSGKILGMLAATLADSATTKFNINDLVGPMSVLLAAAIAAFVAWWNARTSPYGRLQTLIGIHRQWPKEPEELDGLKTVEQSIAFTLARIRHKDGIPASATPTESEVRAEKEITAARRVRIAVILVAGLSFAVLVALVVAGILPAQPAEIMAFGILGGIILGMLPFVRKW